MKKTLLLFVFTIMTIGVFANKPLLLLVPDGEDPEVKVELEAYHVDVTIYGRCENYQETESTDGLSISFTCDSTFPSIICAKYGNGTMEINCGGGSQSMNYGWIHVNNVGSGVKQVQATGVTFH